MLIGRVIGTVIATRKDEGLVGSKLLITQPMDFLGKDRDNPLIAVDTVGAGVGEIVIYVTGSVAPHAVRKSEVPVDAAIVGIVDKIDLNY